MVEGGGARAGASHLGLQVVVTGVSAGGVDSVLLAHDLPELGADLVAALKGREG